MLHKIDATDNIIAFRAIAEVNKDDFKAVVIPAVEKLIKQTNEINFLLVLDTDIENFTEQGWLEEVLLEFKHYGQWHRTAFVSDSEEAVTFTNRFGNIFPGEFRCFEKQDFNRALNWVEGNIDIF